MDIQIRYILRNHIFHNGMLKYFSRQMSTPAEDRRNATAMYNPYSLKEIKEMYPNVSKNKLFIQK